jgi:hypothetical protein
MHEDVARVRPDRPTVFTDLRHDGAAPILEHLRHAVLFDRA